MARSSTANTKETLIDVLDELSEDRMSEILDFALFLKGRQTRESSSDLPRPAQHLEDLCGDFWPENESVDDFIDTVRRWRGEDVALHKDLQ